MDLISEAIGDVEQTINIRAVNGSVKVHSDAVI